MSTCEQCGDVTKCLMAATLNNAANDVGSYYGGIGYDALSQNTISGYQRYVLKCPYKSDLTKAINEASRKVRITNTN